MDRSDFGRWAATGWLAAACIVAAVWATPGAARDAPTLTVVGPGGTHVYDIPGLMALETTEIVTSTPWSDRVERFTGVALARLVDTAPTEGMLRLIALNDYESAMPLAAIEDRVPIIAYLRDGEPMSVRDKGPFWVIFPFDEGGGYRSELAYSRSVWQLVRIEVTP